MAGRALLIDAGNTRLKWAVADRREILRSGTVRYEKIREKGFTTLASRLPRRVEAAMISNVAGVSFGTRLAGFLGIHCGVQPHFVIPSRSAHGITNGYRRPRQLGADRWAAMIGARAETKSALCIVDAGTAITIDALDRDGRHLGGQILPGLRLMADSLKRQTNGIRDLTIRPVDTGTGMKLFATTTERAIPAGSLNAICGAIERSVRIMRQDGLRPKLVITGGGAPRIISELGMPSVHRPHLVLQGLAVMCGDG